MARGKRQNKIIELLEINDIDNQTDLTKLLIANGFNVTQATVSRDIKELGITKSLTPQKKYKYVYGKKDDNLNNRHNNVFKEAVLSMRSAGNIICLKTLVGSANSAGAFIDNLHLEEIIGTIAGDDTIMIVVSSTEKTKEVEDKLKTYII